MRGGALTAIRDGLGLAGVRAPDAGQRAILCDPFFITLDSWAGLCLAYILHTIRVLYAKRTRFSTKTKGSRVLIPIRARAVVYTSDTVVCVTAIYVFS